MKRTTFLSGVAGASAGPFFIRDLARAQSAQVLVGYWPISAALPYYVAAQKGFFKDAGADVQLVKFSDQVKVTEALIAGRINATATGTGSTQLATAEIAQPGLFKILGANLSSEKSVLDEIIVAKGAPYKKIADLKGKKLATGVGPQAVLEAKLIFARNGVDDPIQELSPAQHVAAIASGQIDAAYTYEPNGTVGRLAGQTDVLEDGVRSKYLLGNGDAPWYGGAGVLASDFIKANPAAAKAYIAGLRRGFDEVRKNINESRAVYPTYTSFTVALSEAIPPIQYTLYDEFSPAQVGYFQKNYDLFYDQKILSAKVSVASLLYKG